MAASGAVVRDNITSAMFEGVAANMTEVALWRVTARAYLLVRCRCVPEMKGTLGSAYQVISRQQELHCTLVRINPTSFRNWLPVAWALNRNVRKFVFATPEYPSDSRQYDVFGT
jgi:hypothetical protein